MTSELIRQQLEARATLIARAAQQVQEGRQAHSVADETATADAALAVLLDRADPDQAARIAEMMDPARLRLARERRAIVLRMSGERQSVRDIARETGLTYNSVVKIRGKLGCAPNRRSPVIRYG